MQLVRISFCSAASRQWHIGCPWFSSCSQDSVLYDIHLVVMHRQRKQFIHDDRIGKRPQIWFPAATGSEVHTHSIQNDLTKSRFVVVFEWVFQHCVFGWGVDGIGRASQSNGGELARSRRYLSWFRWESRRARVCGVLLEISPIPLCGSFGFIGDLALSRLESCVL